MFAHGKLAAFDTPANLEKQLLSPSEIALTALAEPERAEQLLSAVAGVAGVEVRGRTEGRTRLLVHLGAADMDQVCRDIFLAFAGSNTVLLELTPKKASLEEVFLELSDPAAPAGTGREEGAL